MWNRRTFVKIAGAAGLAATLPGRGLAAASPGLSKAIPASGERLPVIGMGSSRTFDVDTDAKARAVRAQVLGAFFQAGGTLIDSSPMYGSSEAVIGDGLGRLGSAAKPLFSATKVWTPSQGHGLRQMAESERLWGLKRFDLMQIHNLVNWEGHFETLTDWKKQGRVRYIGITTSHGRRHEDLARILAKQSFDFAQFTYNIVDREVEDRLLPLAAEKGIAVIINRPFQRGALIDRVAGRPLPAWVGEFGAKNWAQFLLKFVVSHPAVTCAIPATTRVDHMVENMGAGRGPLPDAKMRARMADLVAEL